MNVGTKFKTKYHFRCHDTTGKLLWEDITHNLITNEGLNNLLQTYFKGANYYAYWYCGLVGTTGWNQFQASDTAGGITTDGSSSNLWGEEINYNECNRVYITWDDAANQSISNASSPCVFTFSGTYTIKGAFKITDSNKGSTCGILFGEALFSTGDKTVYANNVLTVTITVSAAST